jgi:hypothetical protein
MKTHYRETTKNLTDFGREKHYRETTKEIPGFIGSFWSGPA